MLTHNQLDFSLLRFALEQEGYKKLDYIPYFISEDDHEEILFPLKWGATV